jgi:DNA-binding CsgD family transcriptional regulator
MNSDIFFDDFLDGVLVATEQEVLMVNQAARRICAALMQERQTDGDRFRSWVPSEIWQVCQMMMTGQPSQLGISEGEFYAGQRRQIRMRCRWITLAEGDRPYLMVILEDQDTLHHRIALSEALRYRLTPRETEVWVLHRTGHRRQEIAQQCYITIETVKKHLKSARAKIEPWEEAV